MSVISRVRFYFFSAKGKANYLRKKGNMSIGYGCEIYNNVNFGSEPYLIKIGNKVRITSGVKFVTHDGGLWVIRNQGINVDADKVLPITIGNNVFIGWDTIIMPGVNIGSNVIIGAGSIVTKDLEDNNVYAGSPAKNICTIEEYYEKNIDKIDNTKNMNYKTKENYYKKKFEISLNKEAK